MVFSNWLRLISVNQRLQWRNHYPLCSMFLARLAMWRLRSTRCGPQLQARASVESLKMINTAWTRRCMQELAHPSRSRRAKSESGWTKPAWKTLVISTPRYQRANQVVLAAQVYRAANSQKPFKILIWMPHHKARMESRVAPLELVWDWDFRESARIHSFEQMTITWEK